MRLNMRAERVRLGLTQTELAERLGVTQMTVVRWESGETIPSAMSLLGLSKLYGCAPEYLLAQAEN